MTVGRVWSVTVRRVFVKVWSVTVGKVWSADCWESCGVWSVPVTVELLGELFVWCVTVGKV